MQGVADAAGVDFILLRNFHLLPELTGPHCSMYGAWGAATASTGKTMQMRALDYDCGPFCDFPGVIIRHYDDDSVPAGSSTFASVGFAGWVAAVSGQSAQQMAISEIGIDNPDASFGEAGRVGIPFVFLLRDILQFDASLNDSIHRITTANRTCKLVLGVGSGKEESFRGFEYSASVADVFTPDNMRPYAPTWHPRIPDTLYWGMDWICPTFTGALAKQMLRFHGNVTAENTMKYINSGVQTGSMHVAVYDLTAQLMFVSFERPPSSNDTSSPKNAYARQYSQLSLNDLFNEPAPHV
jgi:isopenicillin-N N-acyltransferase like protein